jgi:atypical dual specificity phosphatase
MAEYGIRCIRSPMPDMGAPGIEQAIELCQTLDRLIAEREVVAVHCRAGLGRTGTVLASYLIWEGASALEALDAVRRIEPRWVQSDTQAAFLEEFAHHLANTARARARAVRSAV